MRKKLFFVLLAVAICPIIMVSVFAAKAPMQAQDLRSIAQLSNYVETVNTANEGLVKEVTSAPVPATITFAKYITFSELEEYLSKYNMEIKQMQLRGLTEDGTRVTVATLISEGMEYTEAVVREQARMQGFELVGITDMYVYILPNEIESISGDDLTFLVESSASEEPARGILGLMGKTVTSTEKTSVFPKSLTWQLEELSILK